MMEKTDLRTLSKRIQNREIKVESLVSRALEHAKQSRNVFIDINEDAHRQAAEFDVLLSKKNCLSPLAGIPITTKDLFDIEGMCTLAGSRVLEHYAQPAVADCEVLKPLRKSGLLFLGRANMSEFAFSGLGINPHYGTPKSIWDRAAGRIPGGSSSGSAVSVAEGIVPASMGSDTAGSCRIPAAFNGIVGVKPSYGRFSLQGIFPLSHSSDAPGPIGANVDSCFIVDQLIAGSWDGSGAIPAINPVNIGDLRFLIPESKIFEDLHPEVECCFDRAVQALADSGTSVERRRVPIIDECVDLFMNRAIAGYEAYALHKEMMEKYADEYDPNVYSRISSYASIAASEQEARYAAKRKLAQSFNRVMQEGEFDAMISPTVSCIPPKISVATNVSNTREVNLQCLRNTAVANNFDGCSMSLPCHDHGTAPVGLMISSTNGDDRRLYEVGAAIESVVEQIRTTD